ncbi:hypothetical protein EPUS_03789 [Endocarpon pusillum Z07020]|uniref:Uncharacterized protein n=1 Tax=Endocarpon pusillum (strain Z07020 / HMAS-L-300199) TaxID=1263415 RepID=U1G9V4_ENDPU|nr:uncharacterized protein EPUS_03789 [Endocarpon pusillum Z07020]ERF68471.1 hypothetical protein EPUS_03789 [Endocarpon pusillum Z07020]
MADIHTDVEDSPKTRLQSLPFSTIRFAQAYKSVAADEIELVSNHEAPSDRDRRRHVAKGICKGFKVASRPAWLRKLFWKDTWSDVKSLPWGWLGRRFLSHILPLMMITVMLVLLVLMSLSPEMFTGDTGDFCKPDGTFSLSFDGYTPWKQDAIFAINLKFGKYKFREAKLIDICWDLGVGRGGQAFLAIFSYLIFTKGLSRTMEASSVSHDTFKAVTLQNDTITGTAVLIKSFFKTGGRRAKLAIFWTIIASLFILFVPTWLSAMTGYTADIKSFVQDKESNLAPAENFKPVIYTIHDGARFGNGFSNETRRVVPWASNMGQLDLLNRYGCNYYMRHRIVQFNPTDGNIHFDPQTVIDCKWMWAVSKYVSDYGFFGKSTALNTTFHQPDGSNITTPVVFSPALNISAHLAIPTSKIAAHYFSGWVGNGWYNTPHGRAWRNPDDGQHTFNVSNPVFWDSSSETLYNLSQFNLAGSCLQQGPVMYKWGFSFLLLYVFLITFLAWTIGMWAYYLDSWLHSRLDGSRRIGVERAVLDLSKSMQSKINADQSTCMSTLAGTNTATGGGTFVSSSGQKMRSGGLAL